MDRYIVKKIPETEPQEYIVYDTIHKERTSSSSTLEQDIIDLCKWFNNQWEKVQKENAKERKNETLS
jgi:hypothetical protein